MFASERSEEIIALQSRRSHCIAVKPFDGLTFFVLDTKRDKKQLSRLELIRVARYTICLRHRAMGSKKVAASQTSFLCLVVVFFFHAPLLSNEVTCSGARS